jgi:hypothetical protein
MNSIKTILKSHIRDQKLDAIKEIIVFLQHTVPSVMNDPRIDARINEIIDNVMNTRVKIPNKLYHREQPSLYSIFLKDMYQEMKKTNDMSQINTLQATIVAWKEHPFALFIKKNATRMKNRLNSDGREHSPSNIEVYDCLKRIFYASST